ncbi:MAG: SIS domain-containing protein [Patescibacteria group bacterium]
MSINSFNFSVEYFKEQNRVNDLLPMHFIAEALQLIEKCYRGGKQIFIIGNGGSASTASHMVCDFQKFILGYKGDRKIPRMKALSLSDNTEVLTAWANDVGYEVVFSEQLKNQAEEGDLLIALSASGNSPNIIRAVDVAKLKGIKIIGLTGFAGGKLKELADVPIHVESNDYGIVENAHLMFGHMAARYLVEQNKVL